MFSRFRPNGLLLIFKSEIARGGKSGMWCKRLRSNEEVLTKTNTYLKDQSKTNFEKFEKSPDLSKNPNIDFIVLISCKS